MTLAGECDPGWFQGVGRDGLSLKRHRRFAPGHLGALQPPIVQL